MPAQQRKSSVPDPNQDQSTPPEAAVTDASETLATQQTEEKSGRRNKFQFPEPGDTVTMRGKVSRPVDRIRTNGRGRPEGLLHAQGVLINRATGKPVTEEREWFVKVTDYLAGAAKDSLAKDEEVISTGKWVEPYSAGPYEIATEIEAYSLARPLDAGVAQDLGTSAADSSGAAGGVGAGL